MHARHVDVLALESECEVAGGLVLVPAMRGKAIGNGMLPFLFPPSLSWSEKHLVAGLG